jgi:hypothetical protein
MNLQCMRYIRNVIVANLAGSVVTRLRSGQHAFSPTEPPKYLQRQPSIRCVPGALPPEIKR